MVSVLYDIFQRPSIWTLRHFLPSVLPQSACIQLLLPFWPFVHCSSRFALKKLQNRFESTLVVSHVTGLFSAMLITPLPPLAELD